jgi:twitching motility two-component system response regulator PilG
VLSTVMPQELPTRAAQLAPRSGTVLVVDDSRVGRMAVESVLKGEGHRVIDAESGQEALEVLEQMRPDLIVLDVRMPGMDGFELCAAVRADVDLHPIPFVLLTSLNDETSRKKGKLVGASAFLTKPVSVDELRKTVGTLLKLPPRR